jgi:hypothetical protein
MIENISRRQALAVFGGICLSGFSGCGQPAARSLSATDMQPPLEQNGDIIIRLQIDPGGKNVDEQEAEFHDVALVGYMSTKRIVGRQSVGTVGLRDHPTVSLVCSELPEYLTFTTNDHGCRYDTSIAVWKVNSANTDSTYNFLEHKHCGDPELPVPDQ